MVRVLVPLESPIVSVPRVMPCWRLMILFAVRSTLRLALAPTALGKVAGFQFEFTFQLSVVPLSVPFHVCAFREEPENPSVAMSTKIAVDLLGEILIL
jgi:hypothetical protein